jgi:hypothetical protein
MLTGLIKGAAFLCISYRMVTRRVLKGFLGLKWFTSRMFEAEVFVPYKGRKL